MLECLRAHIQPGVVTGTASLRRCGAPPSCDTTLLLLPEPIFEPNCVPSKCSPLTRMR